MTDFEFSPTAQRELLSDMLGQTRKLVMSANADGEKCHVQPVEGLVSDCIVKHTPDQLQPDDIAFSTAVALRAAVQRELKTLIFRWDVFNDSLVLWAELAPLLQTLTQEELDLDILTSTEFRNSLINMQTTRMSHRKGMHTT